jgi:hypothetical protein
MQCNGSDFSQWGAQNQGPKVKNSTHQQSNYSIQKTDYSFGPNPDPN